MKWLILLLLPFSLSAETIFTQDDVMHSMAHAGACYIMTHGTEVICNRSLRGNHKLVCTIAGVLISTGVNAGRKLLQNNPGDTNRAILSGAAGSMFAIGIISLDF